MGAPPRLQRRMGRCGLAGDLSQPPALQRLRRAGFCGRIASIRLLVHKKTGGNTQAGFTQPYTKNTAALAQRKPLHFCRTKNKLLPIDARQLVSRFGDSVVQYPRGVVMHVGRAMGSLAVHCSILRLPIDDIVESFVPFVNKQTIIFH